MVLILCLTSATAEIQRVRIKLSIDRKWMQVAVANTRPGKAYVLQSNKDLATTNWVDLDRFISDGEVWTYTINDNSPQRFYRVYEEQKH